jgi:hypothetical protein
LDFANHPYLCKGDTDIKTIKVVLGGAGLNEANDKLVLDTELALNADIAKVTGKTIGTVSTSLSEVVTDSDSLPLVSI